MYYTSSSFTNKEKTLTYSLQILILNKVIFFRDEIDIKAHLFR